MHPGALDKKYISVLLDAPKEIGHMASTDLVTIYR